MKAAERPDTNEDPDGYGVLENSSAMRRAGMAEREVICPYCHGRFDGLTIRHSLPPDAKKLGEARTFYPIPNSPSSDRPTRRSLSRDATNLEEAPWMGPDVTKAWVRQLIDSLATWDHLPFCLLYKDVFLRDFDSGSRRYCSPALVKALLALATQVIIENNDEVGLPLRGCSESKLYFKDAEVAAKMYGVPTSLPDIQALGLLSLYQVGCGFEIESLELAETFVIGMSKLCARNSSKGDEPANYTGICSASYCGAVYLIRYVFDVTTHAHLYPDLSRMIQLTTGRMSKYTQPLQGDSVLLASSSHHAETGEEERVGYCSSMFQVWHVIMKLIPG